MFLIFTKTFITSHQPVLLVGFHVALQSNGNQALESGILRFPAFVILKASFHLVRISNIPNQSHVNNIGISFQFMALQARREIVATYVVVGFYDSWALFPRMHTFLLKKLRSVFST